MKPSYLTVKIEAAAQIARELLALGVIFEATQDGENYVQFKLLGY